MVLAVLQKTATKGSPFSVHDTIVRMNIEPQFHELIAEIKRAGAVAHDYFVSESTENEQKSDGSVVTEVDHAIERQL
jgi:hypothetical protein